MTEHDFDNLGYEEVRLRFDRGDYHDAGDLRAVKKWLRAEDKEREFIAACQRASVSAALDAGRAARRANLVAFLALVVSAISAHEHVGALVVSILSYFSH